MASLSKEARLLAASSGDAMRIRQDEVEEVLGVIHDPKRALNKC